MKGIASIHIAEPCSANWNQMTPLEKGRFCQSCEKEVHDLTHASEAQIIAAYKQSGANMCGRFKTSQITQQPSMPMDKWFKRFLCAVLIAFGVSLFQINGMAQEYINGLNQELLTSSENLSWKGTRTIAGQIVDDQTGESIPFASVHITNKDGGAVQGVCSDFDGNYRLTVHPSDFPDWNTIELKVSSLGYLPLLIQKLSYSEDEAITIELPLKLNASVMGLFVITSYCPPLIDKDPIETNKTTISGEEIRRMPGF